MRTRYQLNKSMLPILGMAFLLSACSATINWDYQRTPSNALAYPRPLPSAHFLRRRPTNTRAYLVSRWFDRAVPRSWPGWRWPT